MSVAGCALVLAITGAFRQDAATAATDALKHFQQAGKYSKQHQGEALLVMQGGKVVEHGLTDRVLDDPRHAYTQTLVSSVLPV